MKSLTLAEKLWLMSNIQKDEQEELEKFKTLVKFIRPEAFKDGNSKVEVTSDFILEIEESLGRKLTSEELHKIETGGEELDNDDVEQYDEITSTKQEK